jgi:hypothetical protein
MKFVRLIDLPTSVRGLTVLDNEGNYNVYLNSRLSYEMQENTYIHETAHIKNDDFYIQESIAEIENRIKNILKEKG